MLIDHIGIVVRSLSKGIREWESIFGYRQASEIVTNTRQRVNVVFLAKETSLTVKLIEPTDSSSPVARFAAKGGGLHHICFRCESLNDTIPTLESEGARLIVSPEPGEAFDGHPIAFLLAASLNVELIDTTKKAGWRERPDAIPANVRDDENRHRG